MKRFYLIILFVSAIEITAQSNLDVEDLFIGQFNTFDPYSVPEGLIKDVDSSFNTNHIYFWLDESELNKSAIKDTLFDFFDDRISTIVKLYLMDISKLPKYRQYEKGIDFSFYYKGGKYTGYVKDILYYKGWSNGYFISIDINPMSFINNLDHDFEIFPIIASTDRSIKLLYDKLFIGQNDSEIYQYEDYKIVSSMKKTGRYGHYGGEYLDSKLSIFFQDKEIYQYKSECTLYYSFGSTNEGENMFMYIVEPCSGLAYTIIKFDKGKYIKKKYFQQYVD